MVRVSEGILALGALTSSVSAARQLSARVHTPVATQARSADVVSSNVLSIRKSGKKAKSASYLGSLQAGAISAASSNYSYGATPVDNLYSEEYIAEIEWDGVAVDVIVDTGSSDTWLVQAGFTCVDYNGNEQSVCGHPSLPSLEYVGGGEHITDSSSFLDLNRNRTATSAPSSTAPSTKAPLPTKTSTSSTATASS